VSDGPHRELLVNNPAQDNDLSLAMIDFMSRCLRGGERNANMYSHMLTSCKGMLLAYVCASVCMYMCSCSCVYVYVFVCDYVLSPSHTHTHTHTHTLSQEPIPLDLPVAAKRKQYYTELYSLAHLTADLKRPFFPVLNGKIGGPGAALAFNSPRAIATERTVFRANYAQVREQRVCVRVFVCIFYCVLAHTYTHIHHSTVGSLTAACHACCPAYRATGACTSHSLGSVCVGSSSSV
jgi:hypothetical protein